MELLWIIARSSVIGSDKQLTFILECAHTAAEKASNIELNLVNLTASKTDISCSSL